MNTKSLTESILVVLGAMACIAFITLDVLGYVVADTAEQYRVFVLAGLTGLYAFARTSKTKESDQ